MPEPEIAGGNFRSQVDAADIGAFDVLAKEAGNTRNKGAGRDLISRRNALLNTYNPYQRQKVGQTYYSQHNKMAGDEGSFYDYGGPEASSFIDLIDTGDDQFLQGLADDPGTGTPPPGGGNNGGGGGQPENWQSIINQLLQNQQNQFNSTLQGFQNSAPTLSVGSVGNAQGTAAARARARNSGAIVNTLSRRGRQSSARPRRYF